MANEIDLVVGQVAFDKITELINRLKDVDTEFGKIATKFSDLGKTSNPQSTAELAKLTAENEKLNKALTELRASYTTIDTELAKANTTRASSSKLITQETIDIRLKNKELTQEYTELSKVADKYQQADAQYRIMAKSLKDLAFQGKEGTKDFIEKEKALLALGNRLKAVDAMTGSHTRNVGNYASSWNGLGNSINQLTREAPAFANSLQTGFMALSNNIPILTDELGVLIDKNKKLQADGKPTESILKTVAGAFFSWQTAISLGVTILTVYGAKLIDAMFNTNGVKRATDSLTNSLKLQQTQLDKNIKVLEYNAEIEIELAKKRGASEKEIFEIKKKLGIDTVSETEKQYNVLNARIDSFDKYRALREKDKGQAILFLRGKYNGDLEKATKEYQRREVVYTDANRKLLVDSKTKLYDQLKEKNDKNVLDELRGQNELNKKAEQLANKPVAQEKKVLKFDEVKSEKDLQQAKIEGQKIDLESADLDKMTTDEKIINRQKLTDIQLATIKSVQEEEIAVADKKRIDDLAENDRFLKNNPKQIEQYNKNIEDINKTHQHVVDKINVEASNKKRQLSTADLKYQEDLLKKEAENAQKYKINQFESEKAAAKLLSEDNRKNEKLTSTERQSNFEQFKKISEKELASQRDFALSKTVIKSEQDLINQEYAKGLKLLENMSDPLEAIKNKTNDWLGGFTKTGLDSPLQAFGMESAKMFLDVKANGETTFSEMYKNAEEGREKFQVAFGAISEVGQGAFNAIAQASMAQYEGEYARLDAQKEQAIKNAGDSSAAKEKIEADYAKKKKEIDKKKFEGEKKIKMVNIVMDTAQAVVAALPNIPLSIIVGVLGAINLGMVAAQQFPAYAEGTDNHRGGMMLVNDGAGSNFQEKVILPNGKVIRPQGRNVLMDAPKGTKVLNHEQQLFEMLQSNNISMSSPQYQGMTPDEMDEILGKHFGNIKTQNTIFDKNGFQTYVRNGNSITRSNSNRSQAIGISV
jgi:hypothetical protein